MVGKLFNWFSRGAALDRIEVAFSILLKVDCKKIGNSQTSMHWPHSFCIHLSSSKPLISMAWHAQKWLVLLW